jgi:uncharacterized membrane protein
MEFSEIQNKNFRSLTSTTSLAFIAFLVFGLLNIAGLISLLLRESLPNSTQLAVLCIILIVTCIGAAVAFKKAANNYHLIVTTENNDLTLLGLASAQLQKALAWAAFTTLVILVRSAYFHANFDFVLK